jgi:hypothetical protein
VPPGVQPRRFITHVVGVTRIEHDADQRRAGPVSNAHFDNGADVQPDQPNPSTFRLRQP